MASADPVHAGSRSPAGSARGRSRSRWAAARPAGAADVRGPPRRRCRVRTTKLWGAASSGPSGNTAKKLGSKRAQFTSRRLVTREATDRPCTSQTISSPTFTPSSRATPASRETGTGEASRPAPGFQNSPATTSLRRGQAVAVAAAVFPPQRPAVAHGLRIARRGQAFAPGHALDRLDAHGHDRHRWSGARARGAQRLGHGLPLIRLDVEEGHVGPVALAAHTELAQQVLLHEQHVAQQESAEAEGQDHGHGLVGGPIEVGQALAQQVGQAAREVAPHAADEGEGAEPQDEQGHADAQGKPEAGAPSARLEHGQRDHAEAEQEHRPQAPAVVRQGRVRPRSPGAAH